MTDTTEEPEYEYVKAVIDCGELVFVYKMPGHEESRMAHDEPEEVLKDYTDADFIALAKAMLDLPTDYPVTVEYA